MIMLIAAEKMIVLAVVAVVVVVVVLEMGIQFDLQQADRCLVVAVEFDCLQRFGCYYY